ncbi:DUF1214 domain-containing protein [Solimonas soli]|uniref:DUF1214 domain-containing protein n=1 Tax=Solimonas soli TaxID=413479 RepID=UPI0004B91F33|nr:DUF1214 domain-containing protein [Solimonas soli]
MPGAALRHGLAIVGGIALGVASAWWAIGRLPDGERYGAWRSDPLTGSTAADAYTRARSARHGLLALNREEALYLIAAQDDGGAPLSERCDYEIRGGTLPAAWWSLTVYAADEFLPRNGSAAYAIDAAHLRRDGDGRWRARLATTREASANWLDSTATGTPSLTLRLYRPKAALRADALPTITRRSCR